MGRGKGWEEKVKEGGGEGGGGEGGGGRDEVGPGMEEGEDRSATC